MSTCRGCGAEVIFVPSAKSGKLMILDAVPRKGVVLWDAFNGEIGSIFSIDPERQAEWLEQVTARVVDVYTDHHATCPKAADFRRPRKEVVASEPSRVPAPS